MVSWKWWISNVYCVMEICGSSTSHYQPDSKIARCSSTLAYQQDSKIARCSSTLRSPSSSSCWAPPTLIGMPAFQIVSIFLSSSLALILYLFYTLAADWGRDMMYLEFLGHCCLTCNWINPFLGFQQDLFWIGGWSCWCSFVGVISRRSNVMDCM